MHYLKTNYQFWIFISPNQHQVQVQSIAKALIFKPMSDEKGFVKGQEESNCNWQKSFHVNNFPSICYVL